ncbi:hypothetical protein B0H17DRAFT_1105506 [Mycena rosella]|uniref:Uncharacterized protein n=1 Tax=Mycena rosella TaxID=1033263 RepID=A0AAD7C6E5_MYCRO|nr:hypothetical protein B0H17DRAFT_1105506 [Mycena rosella]
MIRPTVTALLLLIAQVCAQTLYTVSLENPSFTDIISESITLSVAGVGADGWTTYAVGGSASLEVLEGPSATFTIMSTPVTLEGNFEANSAGWRQSFGAIAETCAFGSDGRGTCVAKVVRASSTSIETYSGSVVPFYTLGVIPGSSTPTPTTPPTSIPSTIPSQTATSTAPNGAAAVGVISPRWIVASTMLGALFRVF